MVMRVVLLESAAREVVNIGRSVLNRGELFHTCVEKRVHNSLASFCLSIYCLTVSWRPFDRRLTKFETGQVAMLTTDDLVNQGVVWCTKVEELCLRKHH